MHGRENSVAYYVKYSHFAKGRMILDGLRIAQLSTRRVKRWFLEEY